MPTANNQMRLGHLRLYLLTLAAEMNATGKFKGAGDDQVEAAARAILSGGGAMVSAMWDDLKSLGGEGRSIAETFATGAAERLAREGVSKAASFVEGLFTGRQQAKTEEKRQVGAQFMKAAEKMGRR